MTDWQQRQRRDVEQRCAALGDEITRLLDTYYGGRAERAAYKHRRRARCQNCEAVATVTVSRHRRLRQQSCARCGGRLRAITRR